MSKRDCVIFDVDGTLADGSHRTKWLLVEPKNWKAWYAELDRDLPIAQVVQKFKQLHAIYDIFIITGRSDDYRDQTYKWLHNHLPMEGVTLYMRKGDDYRPDYIIKAEIAKTIMQTHNIVEVYEDRQSVVKMWQDLGVFVFDVSQGKGNF